MVCLKLSGVEMSGIGAPACTQMPVSVRPSSALLPATSTPARSICAITDAVPMMISAVSPCSSRFCTPPIVAKLSSISSPVSRVNFAATSVTTYFTAPADKTFRCVAARETAAAGGIIQPSLTAADVRDGRFSLLMATCACRCQKSRPTGQADDAILHRDQPGRTSSPQRDAARRRNGERAMPRSSIYVGEIAHQSPIPNASRIGNIIVSGLIRGADPATARLAATLEQQCAFMFLHMRQVVEAGGATVEDIIKVTVWMKELQREPVNDEWVKMFPDPASRPARQIMELPMEEGVLVQCDFLAVVGASLQTG